MDQLVLCSKYYDILRTELKGYKKKSPDKLTQLSSADVTEELTVVKLYLGFGVEYLIMGSYIVEQHLHTKGVYKDHEILSNTGITVLQEGAFYNFTEAKKLYIRDKRSALHTIKNGAFMGLENLLTLYISDITELHTIEPGAFRGLDSLATLSIYRCLQLQRLVGGVMGDFKVLTTLRIRSGLISVPDFSQFNSHIAIHEIDLSLNKITQINSYAFRGVDTYFLDLEHNTITQVKDHAFNTAQIMTLHLSKNPHLKHLSPDAFTGIHDLETLDLSGTGITRLPTRGLRKIKKLSLERTPSLRHFPSVLSFSKIETVSLTYPHHCCAFKNPELQDPSIWRRYEEFLEDIRRRCATTTAMPATTTSDGFYVDDSVGLSSQNNAPVVTNRDDVQITSTFLDNYKTLEEHSRTSIIGPSQIWHSGPYINNINRRYSRRVLTLDDLGMPDGIRNKNDSITINTGQFEDFIVDDDDLSGPLADTDIVDGFGIFPSKSTEPIRITKDKNNFAGEFHDPRILSANGTRVYLCGQVAKDYRKVNCTPLPDAFNPCEDVMGYSWLRVFVWIVVLAALLGNITVIIVLVTSKSKMTVPKFLMCNLAFADLLMGVYLLLLAAIDIHTLGEYFIFAVLWQLEGGCQSAGFLTVFSSELSIYTLAVITLERWYAISHAIHLNKRLHLRQAACIMGIGWIYAAIMAMLPLVGISGYGNVSICLPMEVSNSLDMAYVLTLLVFNGLAFLVICACYINMYWRVRDSDSVTARSSDTTIAKRMALLVFTNFACWAPIAFFGLTASSGLPLIDITNSKILLVFFYPINSCADPFLYAILTKQFHKDFFMLLGKYGICTTRANKYKGAFYTKSLTQSRNNSIALHNVAHANSLDVTICSNLSEFNQTSYRYSPKVSPETTPGIPKHYAMDECSPNITHLYTTNDDKMKDSRKLSTVAENSQTSDDCDLDHRVEFPQTWTARDIKALPRDRPVSSGLNNTNRDTSNSARKNNKRKVEHRTKKSDSQDVSLNSSNTDTSYISDSSHIGSPKNHINGVNDSVFSEIKTNHFTDLPKPENILIGSYKELYLQQVDTTADPLQQQPLLAEFDEDDCDNVDEDAEVDNSDDDGGISDKVANKSHVVKLRKIYEYDYIDQETPSTSQNHTEAYNDSEESDTEDVWCYRS